MTATIKNEEARSTKPIIPAVIFARPALTLAGSPCDIIKSYPPHINIKRSINAANGIRYLSRTLIRDPISLIEGSKGHVFQK